jgi:hypothetical protein
MGANAQTSVPAFTAGQVLTAAQMTQVNTGIPVFASSTERDAAFGGTGEKTLAEGQMAYLEDTNETQYYDGSSWAAVGAGGGKILQVVQATKTSYFGSTSTSFVDTGLAVTITPSDTSSQILIFASVPVRLANSNTRTIDTIYRGSAASGTNLGGGSYSGLTVPYSVTAITSYSLQNTFHILDSPSTTSATTYNHAAKTTNASHGYNLMANEATAVITAIEVSA